MVAALVVVALGAVALWLTMRDGGAPAVTDSRSPSPSVSPSPSLTPSASSSASPSPTPTATGAAAAFADVNGRWCPPDPETDTQGCFDVQLPEVVSAEGVVSYVYPPGLDAEQDPSMWNFDVPANSGGCWVADVDAWPGQSGAAFDYCPAGEVADVDWLAPGDVSLDRLWISQGDSGAPPYVRADDE